MNNSLAHKEKELTKSFHILRLQTENVRNRVFIKEMSKLWQEGLNIVSSNLSNEEKNKRLCIFMTAQIEQLLKKDTSYFSCKKLKNAIEHFAYNVRTDSGSADSIKEKAIKITEEFKDIQEASAYFVMQKKSVKTASKIEKECTKLQELFTLIKNLLPYASFAILQDHTHDFDKERILLAKMGESHDAFSIALRDHVHSSEVYPCTYYRAQLADTLVGLNALLAQPELKVLVIQDKKSVEHAQDLAQLLSKLLENIAQSNVYKAEQEAIERKRIAEEQARRAREAAKRRQEEEARRRREEEEYRRYQERLIRYEAEAKAQRQHDLKMAQQKAIQDGINNALAAFATPKPAATSYYQAPKPTSVAPVQTVTPKPVYTAPKKTAEPTWVKPAESAFKTNPLYVDPKQKTKEDPFATPAESAFKYNSHYVAPKTNTVTFTNNPLYEGAQ